MSKHMNRVAEIRRKKKITQQQLADRLGVHVITVSKLERGVMQLTSAWIERLAAAMDVPPVELWLVNELQGVEASGQLLNSDQIQVVYPEENRFSLFRPPLGDPTARWLHVQDNSLLPYAGAGDLIQFSESLFDEADDSVVMDGRLCMYALEGSDELKLAIREQRLGDRDYDLRSLNGRLLKDCRVDLIYYFSGYQPNWGIVAHFDTDRQSKPADET